MDLKTPKLYNTLHVKNWEVTVTKKEMRLHSVSIFWCLSRPKQTYSHGKYEIDFVCQYQSHEKYPIKKYVLVCHEHRSNIENQQLLQWYKDRCIMRKTQFPAFSKDLKLTFHPNLQTTNNNHEVKILNEEKAIYILQLIKMDQQQYSFLYDTVCSEMI